MEWAKKEYRIRKKKDTIKNNFCISNGIPIFRIPYWETDIELTLKHILGYFKIIKTKNVDETTVFKYLINDPQLIIKDKISYK